MIEAIVIILFNILIYFRTVNYDLVMDDIQHWTRMRKSEFKLITNPHKKPLWFRLYYHLIPDHLYSGTTFGVNLKIEHSFTIFLHTLNCVLMYIAFGHNEISFFAAMLYACNPINNQTSIWLNGRRYAFNISFALLMLIFPLSSIFLYPFSLLLQVTAFFTPILMAKTSLWYLILFPIVCALGWKRLKGRCEGRSQTMAKGDLLTFKPSRIIFIIKSFGFFFFKMIIPGVCSMQYSDRFYWGLTQEGNKEAYTLNKDFWIGCVALVINAGIMAICPYSVKFYAIFMGLAILQWCAIIPIVQILSDRYMSLPNVFMMFLVSYFAHFLGIFYIPLMIVLGIYYLIGLSVVMPMYKNLMFYYDYHFKYFPQIPWPRTLLISDLMAEGKYQLATDLTSEGLRHNSKDYNLLMWGAVMALIKHDFNNSELFLKEAEKNLYINQEESQRKEIKNMRDNLKKVMPKRKGFR